MENDQRNTGSRILLGVIVGIAGAIILMGVYWLGTAVGARRAHFECQWGERYGRVLGMPMMGESRFGPPPGFMDPNGADGEVVSLNQRTIVVKSRDGIEKNVIVSSSTDIRSGRENVDFSNIKVNDRVVIFGSATSGGQIEAKFIRLFGQEFVK